MLPETKYKIILKLKILCSPSLCFALRVITLISDKRVIKVIYTFIGCCFMPGDIMTLQVSCLSSNDLMNILLRLSSIFFFLFFFQTKQIQLTPSVFLLKFDLCNVAANSFCNLDTTGPFANSSVPFLSDRDCCDRKSSLDGCLASPS